jgi:hypothetical protein
MAFRDRSLEGRTPAGGAASSLDYVLNLIRPVVFPFLQDCVQLGRLRLASLIEMSVHDDKNTIAELSLRLDQIVADNGEDLLS